jgi:hypothetical protein
LPTSEEFEKQKRKKEKNGEIESKNPSRMEGNNTMVGSLTNQFFFTNKPHPLFFLYIYVLIWDFYFLFFFFFLLCGGCTVAGICFFLFSLREEMREEGIKWRRDE